MDSFIHAGVNGRTSLTQVQYPALPMDVFRSTAQSLKL